MADYQTQLDGILQNTDINNKPSLLLHSCCGPCSSYCIEYLAKYFHITVYFYNPNIEPKEEYLKRLSTQKELISKLGLCSLEEGEWENEVFTENIKGLENEQEGGARCERCISLRIKKTAIKAKQGGYDYFCSTLTVSPHKNADMINSIGKECEREYAVKWLVSDFKKKEGYKRSLELSKKYNLYRQNYCGCSYSIR